MLKSNLNVLLAERDLKITQVSNETGISRTTLTSLINGNSKGIQFDTLNTLCIYLGITPQDFFISTNFDIKIEILDFIYDDLSDDDFPFHETNEKKENISSFNCLINFCFEYKKSKKSFDLFANGIETERKNLITGNIKDDGTFVTFLVSLTPFKFEDNTINNDYSYSDDNIKLLKETPISFINDLENKISELLKEKIKESSLNKKNSLYIKDYVWDI